MKFDVVPVQEDILLSSMLPGPFSPFVKSTVEELQAAVNDITIVVILSKEGPMTFEEFIENRKAVTSSQVDAPGFRRAFRRLVEAGKVIVIEDE